MRSSRALALETTPKLAQQRASMMSMMQNMDPEVMASMSSKMGGPAISADMAKQARGDPI
jgi:hypothetical protein